MYSCDEIQQIRNVAKQFGKDDPSSHLMEFIVDKADEPGCNKCELCLVIDVLASAGKFSNESNEKNARRAESLKELMVLLSNESDEQINQRKRAMALRYINKLRDYNERRNQDARF